MHRRFREINHDTPLTEQAPVKGNKKYISVLWFFFLIRISPSLFEDFTKRSDLSNIIWTHCCVFIFSDILFFFISAPTNFREFHLLHFFKLFSFLLFPSSSREAEKRTRLKVFFFFYPVCVSPDRWFFLDWCCYLHFQVYLRPGNCIRNDVERYRAVTADRAPNLHPIQCYRHPSDRNFQVFIKSS